MQKVAQTISLERTWKSSLTDQRNLWLGLIFLGSLLFRFYDFYLFREPNADKAHELFAASEWLHGKGISLESYDLNTLTAHTRPLTAWPPAYSIFVAGISKVSGLSVYGASWVLDLMTITALWFV